MKLVILIALIALAAAAPAEKKPAEDKKVAEKNDNKSPAADDKKPAEKKDEERKGLHWPLPDPDNEGDLMLHGAHLFDRVEELRKGKLEKDEDKMVLSVGREYLRRVHKFIEKTTDFKILPVLCRDSERMNSTDRWQIRLRPTQTSFGNWLVDFFRGASSTDSQPEKQTVQVEQGQTAKQQNDATQTKETKQNDPIVPSNSTHENVTENVNATVVVPTKFGKNFEAVNDEYYERMGDNFARILMKRFRKEKLEQEETDYLARWSSDESIHYGMMGIYCNEGENVKELTKRISTFIDEKQ
jgi:hypothetical protein